jgi:hypothetical protein
MIQRIKKWMSAPDSEERGVKSPLISFIVIVFDMPEQAEKTVLSLGCDYQTGVDADDYEVIIVENESANTMRQEFIDQLPANCSYYCREETQPTPAHAISFGASKARGQNICLMIDGARMLTPGVVRNILLGHRLFDSAIVSVPGYHLGHKLQQESVNSGYGRDEELALLNSIAWPADGYRLFEVSCFSGSSAPGFFLANSESNCLSMPAGVWHELGGCDSRFNLSGGGFINLDFYRRACEFPGVRHVILPGEGTFHQFHGGVTTGGEESDVRDSFIEASREQYRQLRGYEYKSPQTNPVFLGEFPVQMQRFLQDSSERVLQATRKSTAARLQLKTSAQ